jgi:hypothetical protein
MKRRPNQNIGVGKRARPTTAKAGVEIIVRRGALRRFDSLTKKTVGLDVELSWDRRVDDKASPSPSERRSKPPFTWEVADFIVVERPTRNKKPSG